MRIVLLTSNIVIGIALLTNAGVTYAASTAKAHKHSSKRHVIVTKHKNIDHGDVWRRIGAGLRLPRPDLELAALAEQANEDKYSYLQGITTKFNAMPPSEPMPKPALNRQAELDSELPATIPKFKRLVVPAKAMPPKDNYTALGRKILGKTPSESASGCEPNKNKFSRLESIKAQKIRVRTQFDFHPELHKHTAFTARTVAYKEPIGNDLKGTEPCVENDLKKLVRLAQYTSAAEMPPVTNVRSQPSQALETQMQLLAAQQQEQEAQRSAKLMANNERVSKYVNWYAQRRFYLYEVAERAKPYLYHIVDGLSKNHLPLDLALLPIVESAYQPTALSPKSAAGLWQFIPSTGLDYNLTQDAHYDERLDIAASTRAAISYLAFLNQRFKGDWLLALAAYNCGIGRVEDAMSRNIAEGLDADYWSLQLPEETQEYVPRLLALSTLMANPANYKLKLTPIWDEPYFITVNIDRKPDINNLANMELKAIAELANVPYEQFTLLNPGYLEPTLPPDRPVKFLMPIPNANQLHQRLTMLAKIDAPTQKTLQPFSTVKSWLSAATEHHLSAYTTPYLSLNLAPALQKPSGGAPVTPKQMPKRTQESYLTIHYVDKGENLQTLARHFDVSVEALRALNKLKRRQGVALGQRLEIPPQQAKSIMLEANNSENKEVTLKTPAG